MHDRMLIQSWLYLFLEDTSTSTDCALTHWYICGSLSVNEPTVTHTPNTFAQSSAVDGLVGSGVASAT